MQAGVTEPDKHSPGARIPVCSICIANFNGEQMLDDCLGSIFAQTGAPSLEVIVHDDASTDRSLAVLQRYPNVAVIASAENVGFCVANNRMAARATGDYVLLLNNDAALHPDGIATLVASAREGDGGVFSLPQYDWDTKRLVDRGCTLDLFYNAVPNLHPVLRDVAMVQGACLFLRRSLWNELGGFPEWMESLAEDAYLCCRARLAGGFVRVAAESGYLHRQGKSFGGSRVESGKLSTTYRRRWLSERNKTAVLVICTPTWLVWPLLAIHFLVLIAEGLLLSLAKRDIRPWKQIYGRAISWTWRELGALLVTRRAVQSSRRISLPAYLRAFVFLPRKLVLLWRHGVPALR